MVQTNTIGPKNRLFKDLNMIGWNINYIILLDEAGDTPGG